MQRKHLPGIGRGPQTSMPRKTWHQAIRCLEHRAARGSVVLDRIELFSLGWSASRAREPQARDGRSASQDNETVVTQYGERSSTEGVYFADRNSPCTDAMAGSDTERHYRVVVASIACALSVVVSTHLGQGVRHSIPTRKAQGETNAEVQQ